jgi:D-aminoacyl-tRNA deacylase
LAAKYNVAIVFSYQDPAGLGTAETLKNMVHYTECNLRRAKGCWFLKDYDVVLAGFEEDDIYFDFLDEVFEDRVDGYIVLSRHSGGKPSLTVHHPGNPGPEAPYGGKPRSLPPAWPRLAAHLLRTYKRVAGEKGLGREFQITLEATHHGPTELKKPIVFIEIGSSEREWVRGDAQRAMAETVLRVLEEGPDRVECVETVIGIGDTHYPVRHTRNVLERGYCYGHIFSKHVLQYLDEEILSLAVSRSVEPIRGIVLAKVPSAVKKLVIAFAEKHGLKVEK